MILSPFALFCLLYPCLFGPFDMPQPIQSAKVSNGECGSTRSQEDVRVYEGSRVVKKSPLFEALFPGGYVRVEHVEQKTSPSIQLIHSEKKTWCLVKFP